MSSPTVRAMLVMGVGLALGTCATSLSGAEPATITNVPHLGKPFSGDLYGPPGAGPFAAVGVRVLDQTRSLA